MTSAPPPSSSVLSVAVDEVQDVVESMIQAQGSSEREMKAQECFVAPKAKSWVGVAEEKELRKYNVAISDSDGQASVEIPDEVVVDANPLWEDFLIGKFLDNAPHVARIHAVVNKIWREGGKGQPVEVYEVDSTAMKFKVPDAAMRIRILRRGMWNIGNIPLVVTKWVPDELMEKPELQSIPMWVYLKNVPINMFSWKGLSFITSAVGHPVRLHPETASCSNFKLAKIFVNADLSKELPKKINFTKNGKSSLVEFIYPRLPTRCNTCGKWGHIERACVMNKKDETFKSVAEVIKHGIEGKSTKGGISKESDVMQNGNDENIAANELGKEAEELGVGKLNGTVNTVEVSTAEKNLEEGEVVQGWSTPGKARRSPTSKVLKYGEVEIASRFSALEDLDDNGNLVKEIAERDKEASLLKLVDEEIVAKRGELNVDCETEGASSIPEAVTSQANSERPETATGKEKERDNQVVEKEEKQRPVGSATGGNSNMRPSLPRSSKTNHRIVPSKDSENPGHQEKRNNRKSSQ